MSMSNSTFMTGFGTGQENVTREADRTSTGKAIKGASLSSFTDAYKFNTLIENIAKNTTNGTANMHIMGQRYLLSGSYGASGVVNPATNALENTANSLVAGLTDATINNADLTKKLKLDRPGIMNMSSAGFLPSVENLRNSINEVKSYMPPSTIALDAFAKLGAMIDKEIKDTLVVQLSGIKGTDLLCTSICLLMSLLPCKVNNEVMDAIDYIKNMQASMNSGINAAISAESQALSSINGTFSQGLTGLANVSDMKDTVNTALGKGPKTTDKLQNTTNLIKATIATMSTVVQVLNLLVSVIRLSYQDPWSVLGWLVNGVYDLLENVLVALQSMAIQIADSIMNKVIAPVEKYLNNSTFPALCGLSAQLLFRKLLQMIYNFKEKILGFIKDLFTFQKKKRTQFQLFNSNLSLTLELSAFLNIFKLLLNNFLTIAIACSLARRDCKNSHPIGNMSENYNGVYEFDPPIMFPNSGNGNVVPAPATLNDIAIKMQPLIDSIFPGTTNTVTPGMVTSELKDVPKVIQDLLVNVPLGPNFSIYNNDNTSTIVYQRPSFCS